MNYEAIAVSVIGGLILAFILWALGWLQRLGAWLIALMLGRRADEAQTTPQSRSDLPFLSIVGVPHEAHPVIPREDFRIRVANSGPVAARVVRLRNRVFLVDEFGEGAAHQLESRNRNPGPATIAAGETVVLPFELQAGEWSIVRAGLALLRVCTEIRYQDIEQSVTRRYRARHEYSPHDDAFVPMEDDTAFVTDEADDAGGAS